MTPISPNTDIADTGTHSGVRSMVSTLLEIDEQQVDAAFTTTRQAGCLNTLRVAGGLGENEGPLLGVSLTTGKPLHLGIHALYRAHVIDGTNAAIVGGYGASKSSLTKCSYGLRAIEAGTRVLVFDRKRQRESGARDERGEYLRLASKTPSVVIVLDRQPGRGTRVNILDPALQPEGNALTGVGQDELLLMCVEMAMGHKLHDDAPNTAPHWALNHAHQAALATARAQGRVPVLQDVIDALYQPTRDAIPGPDSPTGKVLTDLGLVDHTTVVKWGLPVAMALERFTNGDLSGLLDGETRGPDGHPIDLSAPLTVVDTSALPDDSEALGVMMATLMAYVQARWMAIPGDKIIVNEEAYSVDRLTAVPTVMRAIAKRGRASGTSVVTVLHHLSDLKEGSDLWSLIREADIVHLFRQGNADDAEQACHFWHLDPKIYVPIITTLQKGVHLLLITNRAPELVQHLRTPLEEWITNTDSAMEGLETATDDDNQVAF